VYVYINVVFMCVFLIETFKQNAHLLSKTEITERLIKQYILLMVRKWQLF